MRREERVTFGTQIFVFVFLPLVQKQEAQLGSVRIKDGVALHGFPTSLFPLALALFTLAPAPAHRFFYLFMWLLGFELMTSGRAVSALNR
jgi:hypothetical protein